MCDKRFSTNRRNNRNYINNNNNNKRQQQNAYTHSTAQQQIQSFECYALGMKKERKKHVKKIVAAKPSMCFGSVRKSTTIFEQINKMPVEKQRQITIACFRFIFFCLSYSLSLFTLHVSSFLSLILFSPVSSSSSSLPLVVTIFFLKN